MTDRFYTQEDSDEIRRVYFEALRNSGRPDTRKTLITVKEWFAFERAGRDMSRYEIWQDFLKRMRKLEMEKQREKYGTHIKNNNAGGGASRETGGYQRENRHRQKDS